MEYAEGKNLGKCGAGYLDDSWICYIGDTGKSVGIGDTGSYVIGATCFRQALTIFQC